MNVQEADHLEIPEGYVATIHDSNGKQLWGGLNYSVAYDGDCEQNSYTGKNLWGGVSSYSRSISDVDFTTNADGSITAQGTASLTAYSITAQLASQNNVYKTLEAGTYYLSSKDTLPAGFQLQVVSVPDSHTLRDGVGSFTLSVQTSIAVRVRITSGVAVSTATTVFPMLELSSTATTYEPYVGGIPAPNPDYPQPISVVKGHQTVTLTGGTVSGEYALDLTSKNLFNKSDSPISAESGVASELSTGIRITTTTSTTGNVYSTFLIGDFSSMAGQYLTISSDMTASGDNLPRLSIGLCKTDGSDRTTKATLDVSGETSILLDATELATRPSVYIYAYANKNTGDAQADDYVDYTNLMIELGSAATAYAPYYNYELCKVGTYSDYIYKDSGNWYAHKGVQHLSLRISDMDNNEQYPGWRDKTVLLDTLGTDLNSRLSTITQYLANIITSDTTPADTGVLAANTRGTGSLFFQNATWNQTYWKTNYPNLTLELYYGILLSQADTQITDTTLISQLEAIYDFMKRYGYTSAVSGDLPIIISRTPY